MKHFYFVYFLLIATLIFSCNQFHYNPNTITESTQLYVNKLARNNVLMGSAVGIAAKKPEQYEVFEKLLTIATNSELKALTNHPNGVVRCYALWGLILKKSIDVLPIIIDHIEDYELIQTQFGCIGDRMMVGDFFADFTYELPQDGNPIFSREEIAKFDSIFISSNSKLEIKNKISQRVPPIESLYPIIKKRVEDGRDLPSLVLLAKYKKEDDVPLIANFSNQKSTGSDIVYFWIAVQKFPHQNFFNILKEQLPEVIHNLEYSNFEYFNAVARYQNNDAKALLKSALIKDNEDSWSTNKSNLAVFKAIRQYYSVVYDELLWELWVNYDFIALNVYRSFCKSRRSETLNHTIKILKENWNKFFRILIQINISEEDRNLKASLVLDSMLDFLTENNPNEAIAIIKKNITDADLLMIPSYTGKIIQLKDSSFIEPLLIRFKSSNNPHLYLPLAKALKSFNDKGLTNRLWEIINSNTNNFNGWGLDSLNILLN